MFSILKTIFKNTKNKPKHFAIILVLGWDKDEYVCNSQGMHRRAFLSLMMENLLQFWPPCMGSRRFQKVRGTCILDGYHTWALGEMEHSAWWWDFWKGSIFFRDMTSWWFREESHVREHHHRPCKEAIANHHRLLKGIYFENNFEKHQEQAQTFCHYSGAWVR